MTALRALRCSAHALPMRAARPTRAWMDKFDQRHPYRCLPLVIANQWGWELLAPCSIEAEWAGSARTDGIAVRSAAPVATSHFGGGVLTMHLGYVFRTEPGVGLRIDGPPNAPKDGVAPLSGVIESEWLPFTATMNWIFTRPGVARWEQGEPLAVVSLAQFNLMSGVAPEVHDIDADPQLAAEFAAWRDSRAQFNAMLKSRETSGWQKTYNQGRTATGATAPNTHRTKLDLGEPSHG